MTPRPISPRDALSQFCVGLCSVGTSPSKALQHTRPHSRYDNGSGAPCINPEGTMHIYRVDHDASHTHSWLVTVQRRGRVHSRHFTDAVYGSKRHALEAAIRYRDVLLTSLRPLTRPEICRIRKRNNRSGISGVTRIDTWENSRGRRVHRRYWLAQWPVGNGKASKKKFSIKQYGEREARQRALHVRQQALRRLAKVD